jgi:hypothetical protein
VTSGAEFGLERVHNTHGRLAGNRHSLCATAYAIKAIKRRYQLIPLNAIKNELPTLLVANTANSAHTESHD